MNNFEQNKPLVSVIIPSFNHAPFIRECLESVCSQDYPRLEVTVIDDGSDDGSREILEDLREQLGYRLILQENRGLGVTVNRGITEFGNGKYIAICASDDTWLPGKLTRQVDYLENHPDVPMVYGKSLITAGDGTCLEKQTTEMNSKLKGGAIFREIIMLSFHPPVNYLYRTEIFRETGLFDLHGCAVDFDMNLRISCRHPIGFIPEFLATYRRGNNSHYNDDPLAIVRSHRASIDRFKNSPLYGEAVRRWHYRNFLWFAYRKKYKLFALKSMLFSTTYCLTKPYLKGIRNLLFRWRK